MKKWQARVTWGVVCVLCGAANGQWVHQDVTLAPGWNAIYLHVQPESNDCATVFKDWPLESVSLYSIDQESGQFSESPSESSVSDIEFRLWYPNNASGSSFRAVLGGHTYLVKATAPFSTTLYGRPVVPRATWIPSDDAKNLMGFCVADDGTAMFSSFFDGQGLGIQKIYTVGGTNAVPMKMPFGGFNGALNSPIASGVAYFIQNDHVSDYCGPIRVSPAGSRGLDFREGIALQELMLKNESGQLLRVTVQHAASDVPPGQVQQEMPSLLYFGSDRIWAPFTGSVTKTLESGETWTVQLAINRSEMTAGADYGSIIECMDELGSLVKVPVSADYASGVGSEARWPAGLWVGKAVLNEVSQIQTNGILNGVAAGGEMTYRLILHVDTNNVCRLLQRVILAGSESAERGWETELYLNEALLPGAAQAVRVSSTAFSLKNNIAAGTGLFGGQLDFSYVIEHDDPVNPFLHPYHPDHDGLRTDFETPLPSGDVFTNYIGPIKPETFSISNTISMVWNTTNQVVGSALWTPEEKVFGDYTHTVNGLRRQGGIEMGGVFMLQRVSKVGSLTEE